MGYVRIEHPLFPEGVEVREELLKPENKAQLNQELINLGGKVLPEDEEGGYTKDFIQGITSSIRGIADFVDSGVTETPDAQNLEMYQRMRSEGNYGAFAARMAGELLDPVTAPAAVLKVLKAGNVVKELMLRGAAAGGFSGVIQPVFEEFGDSRLFNTAAGVTLGTGIGAALGTVARKLGYGSADDMAKAMQDMSPEDAAKLEESVKAEVLKLESPQAMDARKAEEGFAERAEQMTKDAQLEEIRRAGDEAGEEIRATQQTQTKTAEEDATQQELLRLATEGQRNRLATQEYEANIQKAVKELEEDVATLPSRGVVKKFEARAKNVQADIKKLDTKLDNLMKARKALDDSKTAPKAKRARLKTIDTEINRVTNERDGIEASFNKREGRMLTEINALKDARTQLNDYYNKGIVPELVRNKVGEPPRPVERVEQTAPVRQEAPAPEQQPLQMFPEGMAQAGAPVPPPAARQVERLGEFNDSGTGVQRVVVPADSARAAQAQAIQPPVSPSQPRSPVPSATPQGTPQVADKSAAGRGVENVLGALSTSIARYAPEIVQALRKYESVVMDKVAKYTNPTEPFFKSVNKLSPEMRQTLKGHLYSGRFKEAEAMMNPDMVKQFRAIRSDLDKIHAELRSAGIDVQRLDNYFPRKVKDVRGLRDKLGREHTDKFTKALRDAVAKNDNKPLSPEQEEEVINKVVRDVYRPKDPTRRGNVAQRTLIGDLPDELLPFYHEPQTALTLYHRNMVEMAEKAKFFGRNKQVTDENKLDTAASIGSTINDLRIQRNLTPSQVDDLTRALTARFTTGEQAPATITRWTRDWGYIGTIGNVVSAITNLGDLGTSGALHGFIPTMQAAFGGKANKYKTIEMGIDHTIAHELQDTTKTAKALQSIFKYSGFRGVDRFGKETIMNAAMRKNEKLAKSDAGKEALRKKWGKFFGDETEGLINDLEKGNISPNTKLLAFHELSDMQPISLSEMPLVYLENPNGRIFYMLKSFTLKQLDIVRRNVVQEAAKGNVFKASKNMALIAGYLAAANTSTQVVKDWIQGRDIEPEMIPDQAMWNVLGVFGVNKYVSDRYLAQGDVKGALINTVFPAMPIFDSAGKLTREGVKALEGEDYNLAKASRALPIVGPLIYNWFGGANENYNKRLAGDMKDKRMEEAKQKYIERFGGQ